MDGLFITTTNLVHPVGRSISSDWIISSLIMVLYENFFLVQSEFGVQKTTTILKLFTNHSELDILPAVCDVTCDT